MELYHHYVSTRQLLGVSLSSFAPKLISILYQKHPSCLSSLPFAASNQVLDLQASVHGQVAGRFEVQGQDFDAGQYKSLVS